MRLFITIQNHLPWRNHLSWGGGENFPPVYYLSFPWLSGLYDYWHYFSTFPHTFFPTRSHSCLCFIAGCSSTLKPRDSPITSTLPMILWAERNSNELMIRGEEVALLWGWCSDGEGGPSCWPLVPCPETPGGQLIFCVTVHELNSGCLKR